MQRSAAGKALSLQHEARKSHDEGAQEQSQVDGVSRPGESERAPLLLSPFSVESTQSPKQRPHAHDALPSTSGDESGHSWGKSEKGPHPHSQAAQQQHGLNGQHDMSGHNGVGGGGAGTAGSWVSGVKRAPALAGVRSWLKMDMVGFTSMVQLERHTLERQLGVQLRDFRVLDAVLGASYPSCILVRPQALVVNIEMVKCIISRTYVLINNTDVDRVKPVVEALKDRLKAIGGGTQTPTLHQPPHHTHTLPSDAITTSNLGHAPESTPDGGPPLPPVRTASGPGNFLQHTMPFELTVLEVCLEQVFLYLDRLTTDLDHSARQAIDKLLIRLTAKSLERVRLLKNRIAFVQKKVSTAKELLRKLLEDDKAMAGMNLTARQEWEELQEAHRSVLRHQSTFVGQTPGAFATGLGPGALALGLPPQSSNSPWASFNQQHNDLDKLSLGMSSHTPKAHQLLQQLSLVHNTDASQMSGKWPQGFFRSSLMAQHNRQMAAGSSVDLDLDANPTATNLLLAPLGLEEGARIMEEGSAIVEMLLEAFYLQVDQTTGKAEACQQAIHDTEDFINIKLDQQRNQLISVELMVSIAALVLAGCAVVTGAYGMNMPNGFEQSSHGLIEICGYMIVVATLLWAAIISVAMRRGIITWVPWSGDAE